LTAPDVETASPIPAAYIVQPGDTLAAIARSFGLSWPEIAAANGITWPYSIRPGQVLILPSR
jgi:LysM repeat protein